MEKFKEKRKVSPERARKLLAENGTHVSLEQAKLIVDLMYMFADIALRPYTSPKSPPI
ncbi:hypothetical protein [Pedobacter frigoris]|uniref:hypothetical protein n=1 Tax=Pedobacter frigoris TaxID=2571272 RepID=UPI00292E1A7B|nr:hypothetical protein [Pedobacter frigoris]